MDQPLIGPIVYQPKSKPRNILGPDPLRLGLGSKMEGSETPESNTFEFEALQSETLEFRD